MSDETRCFIGLGSNLNHPAEQIKTALRALRRHPDIANVVCSSLYASKPMGPQDQPDYVNAVAMLATSVSAHDLLDILQAIEHGQGRVRQGERWGARTLDLDLLMYGDEYIDTERLRVPHPGIAERGFVLLPWCEISPETMIPGQGYVRDLAKTFARQALVKLENPPR